MQSLRVLNLDCTVSVHVQLYSDALIINLLSLFEYSSAVHNHYVSVPLCRDVWWCGSRIAHVPLRTLDGSLREEARSTARNEWGALIIFTYFQLNRSISTSTSICLLMLYRQFTWRCYRFSRRSTLDATSSFWWACTRCIVASCTMTSSDAQ